MGKTPNPGKRRSGAKKKSSGAKPGFKLIFRRYKTVNGRKLDAHDYGHKAWPMWVKR